MDDTDWFGTLDRRDHFDLQQITYIYLNVFEFETAALIQMWMFNFIELVIIFSRTRSQPWISDKMLKFMTILLDGFFWIGAILLATKQ